MNAREVSPAVCLRERASQGFVALVPFGVVDLGVGDDVGGHSARVTSVPTGVNSGEIQLDEPLDMAHDRGAQCGRCQHLDVRAEREHVADRAL